jgi:hypothetical protein
VISEVPSEQRECDIVKGRKTIRDVLMKRYFYRPNPTDKFLEMVLTYVSELFTRGIRKLGYLTTTTIRH